MKRNKKISKYRERNINSESVRILEIENWPSISHPQINNNQITKIKTHDKTTKRSKQNI